jgi:hypothetical protein
MGLPAEAQAPDRVQVALQLPLLGKQPFDLGAVVERHVGRVDWRDRPAWG